MGARWFDFVLVVALAGLSAVVGFGAERRALTCRRGGPCNWKDGTPCGCHPEVGNCAMPCDGCCPRGCWPTKTEDE